MSSASRPRPRRPGEIIAGPGPVPAAPPGRTATVMVTNHGRFDAYLTSHLLIVNASAALRFHRDGLEGARPRLPSGTSVRIPAGETVAVELTWS